MDRESWENLQFLLVYKIRYKVEPDSEGHDMMKLYRKWIKFEEATKKQYDEELKKAKSDLKSKRGK